MILVSQESLQTRMKTVLVVLLGLGLSQAYHPYVTKPSEEIDSTEHGVGFGSKKTTCNCGWANRFTQRIVGGAETDPNQFPFIVGLTRITRLGFFCGGTILTTRHVITAAHCTAGESARNLAIVAGMHDVRIGNDAAQLVEVSQIKDHHGYENQDDTNDMSILVLAKDIVFNQKVGPACMPHSRNQYNLVDKYIKVMGWGKIITNGATSPYLKHTNLRVIPLDICKRSFRAFISTTSPKQICTFGKRRDTCQGDSGGPLLYVDPETNRYTLIGLVSYGADCASLTPGVNTEVAAYLDWIQSTIDSTSRNLKTCTKA